MKDIVALIIVTFAAFFAGAFAFAFAFVSQASINWYFSVDFLKQLISATTELLGFTGIILGIMYTSWRYVQRQKDKLADLWESRIEDIGKEITAGRRKKEDAFDMLMPILNDIQETSKAYAPVDASHRTGFRRLFSSAALLGIALIIELVHLQIAEAQVTLSLVSPVLSGMDAFLVTLGIGLLLDAIRLIASVATAQD